MKRLNSNSTQGVICRTTTSEITSRMIWFNNSVSTVEALLLVSAGISYRFSGPGLFFVMYNCAEHNCC